MTVVLDEVVCAACGLTREDAGTCERCGIVDCCDVERRSYDCGDPADGLALCSDPDCSPSHRGCPECDPIMPWER